MAYVDTGEIELRSKASDIDACYMIVNAFLDGKLNGLLWDHNLHPVLIDVLQKIAALKVAYAVVCDGKDEIELERKCLDIIRRRWSGEN